MVIINLLGITVNLRELRNKAIYLLTYALPISGKSGVKTSNVAKRVERENSQCARGQQKNSSMLHYQTKD